MAITPVTTNAEPSVTAANSSTKPTFTTDTTAKVMNKELCDNKSFSSTSSISSNETAPKRVITKYGVPASLLPISPTTEGGSIIQDLPLPNPRELSKFICRIVDTEVYSNTDREKALETLKNWAAKQSVSFGNDFVDVGGLRQILYFIEDNMDDCRAISLALVLLEILCKPLEGSKIIVKGIPHTVIETKSLTTMRARIRNSIVDAGGINILNRLIRQQAQLDGSGEYIMEETTAPSILNVVPSSCFLFECGDSATTGTPSAGAERDIEKLKSIRHSLELLVLLIPHIDDKTKDAPAKILQTLSDIVPILLKENKQCTMNECESLITVLMTCLAETFEKSSNSTLEGPKHQRARDLLSTIITSMDSFPNHQGINHDGCRLLQRVCRCLEKNECKRLGAVDLLGSVVVSEGIDQNVKDIANAILEEQFRCGSF